MDFLNPFIPIVVKNTGEAIRPNSNFHYTDEHKFDQHNIHIECGGIINFRRVSTTHKRLFCPGCGLGRYFPIDITTYGELRAHFAKVLKPRSRHRRHTPPTAPARRSKRRVIRKVPRRKAA